MNQDLEEKITQVGRQIYSLMGGEVPSLFDRKRWNGRLMGWVMKDEYIKTQLFRFVDVLPCLSNDALVLRMLNEYFDDVPDNLLLQSLGRISGIVPHIAARSFKTGIEAMAARFIAGQDEHDGLRVLKKLRQEGVAFTVDLLGEEVLSDKEARQYADRYKRLLTFLNPAIKQWQGSHILDHDDQGSIPRLDVSMKVSSFYSQLDPRNWGGSIEHAKRALGPIVKLANELGASITLDMEHYYFKDLTIAVFNSLLDEHIEWQFAGIALQAYLPETKEDLLSLIRLAERRDRRITVRLVKGAYWDYETAINLQKGWSVPVLLKKEETDLNYEELTRILLENTRHVRPAIATHNIRSISHAIAVADSLKVPREAFEFQMIYGMAEPVRGAVKNLNYRVRAYTPVGTLIPGMAYLIRRLLENTSNESFLRKSFLEKSPFEELIKAPEPMGRSEAHGFYQAEFMNEPLIDFSKAENRRCMEEALQKAKKELGKRYPIFIGKESVWTDHENRPLNPTKPDEIVGRVCIASRENAQAAIEAARQVWPMWRNTSPQERSHYLLRAAEEMRHVRFELMTLEIHEVGKAWPEADGDVAEAIDYLEYYSREMIKLSTPTVLGNYPGEANEYFYEPRGVGLVISPWNFPLAIPTGMVAASLVTGNCVIFKPSGMAPVLGWKLVEIFRSVGLPPGVLQFVPGPGQDIGEYLVGHSMIDFVTFTGSRDVGLNIVKLAGETQAGQANVKRVIAEMGGKNAIILDETADLDEAVKGVVESALSFQGQKCSACSRVIVVGDIFDEFCERLKNAMESIIIGPPEEPGVFMGPVIDETAMKKIENYIELGKNEGKAILIRTFASEGYFVGPAVFTNVSPDARIAQDEIFGPVLVIMKAPDINAALEMANSTSYALTGGIFTRSPVNIRKVKRDLKVGNFYINRKITGALVGRQPFGGFGMSGIGSKAGGPDYLQQFMNIRSVSENTLRRGFSPRRASS